MDKFPANPYKDFTLKGVSGLGVGGRRCSESTADVRNQEIRLWSWFSSVIMSALTSICVPGKNGDTPRERLKSRSVEHKKSDIRK